MLKSLLTLSFLTQSAHAWYVSIHTLGIDASASESTTLTTIVSGTTYTVELGSPTTTDYYTSYVTGDQKKTYTGSFDTTSTDVQYTFLNSDEAKTASDYGVAHLSGSVVVGNDGAKVTVSSSVPVVGVAASSNSSHVTTSQSGSSNSSTLSTSVASSDSAQSKSPSSSTSGSHSSSSHSSSSSSEDKSSSAAANHIKAGIAFGGLVSLLSLL